MAQSLEELGKQAYQKAVWSDYKGAVDILNRAIMKYPNDARLYNNRCFCYFKMEDYKSALKDAELMAKEFPTYSKSHYRKAEVLIELKKYLEAEVALREFLKLEPDSDEGKFFLREVQIAVLRCGGKYSVHDAITALALTNFNTSQAKAFLDVGGLKGVKVDKDEIYYSDDESEEPAVSGAASVRSGSDNNDYDPCTDPTNPFKSNSVWVGNVTKKITEDNIKPLFAKYGKIKSIIVQHQNFCAFVNYMDYNMASVAMKKFPQNLPFEDTQLIIRFPDNAKSNFPVLGKKNGIKIK